MSYFANAKTPKSIVHISSIVGQDPAPVTPIYCATQARDQRLRQIPSNLRWSWHPCKCCCPRVHKNRTEHPEKMKLLEENERRVGYPGRGCGGDACSRRTG
ncbi:uncharacterized protein BDCG_16895 [Blastomyces dermatitidis ER-3]|uniref:Uncharacterized protein n=3 Tax=Blastomyces TaxID=229219 RepID=A0A179U9U9_BLAGS|nr:uncharacterized protein BDBG_16325 [Blastomyces gilchristii SLH14081]XP_045280809.1 uncharacterized protein BDCG_16895 [Blastomyces dermatitidis ER-3]EGE81561.2 NAD-dependent 15-hydroxyprostaglandin dehydrogenase [Blastomyces dermatitidis ATCC 18188]OAT01082.1 hypothetical protein BDCG_16895 [Blastomyces dermatitidis ER-3]OAT04724.1 hypothetical protein BDBG_16325 [Blastomyces gilchristii SLH14081]